MSDQTSVSEPTAKSGGPDPLVSLAFALGWQMADLYRDAAAQSNLELPRPDDTGLRGVGSLPRGKRTALGLGQLQAGLHQLEPRLPPAGARPPSLTDVRIVFATSEAAEIQSELRRFHEDLIAILSAADFRL